MGSTPLPPVTFPWIAWPILMMGALWFRHLEGVTWLNEWLGRLVGWLVGF